MTLLNPPPAEVADLLIRMTNLDWPTNEADRRRYFDILDLDDLDTVPKRDDEPDTRMIRFVTALPDVDGTCTMFRDELLGLSLFCYNEPIDNGPDARAGYVSLQDELTRFLGVPSEEWGTSAEPACLWRAGTALDRHVLLSTTPQRSDGGTQPRRTVSSQRRSARCPTIRSANP